MITVHFSPTSQTSFGNFSSLYKVFHLEDAIFRHLLVTLQRLLSLIRNYGVGAPFPQKICY